VFRLSRSICAQATLDIGRRIKIYAMEFLFVNIPPPLFLLTLVQIGLSVFARFIEERPSVQL
jgi:hypothetical protein